MDHTKIDTAALDAPCQELLVRSLGIFVALLFFLGIIFLCEITGGVIQL